MRLRILPTLGALALAALFFALGQWQLGRAAAKDAQYAQAQAANRQEPETVGAQPVDPVTLDHRRVLLTGSFVPEATIYLDNRVHDGVPGFHVLTPLRIADGMAVVVNRGWMPAEPGARDAVAPPPTPTGTVHVEGIAASQVSSYFALRGAAAGKLGGIWPNFSFDAYVKTSGLQVQPIVVQQTSAGDDGLVRDWPTPGAGSEKHIAYAVQWFALAALALGFWVWFVVLGRGSKEETKHDGSVSAG